LEEAKVNKQMMKFGAILCLVAIVSFSAWPAWKWLTIKKANPALVARTKAIVEKHPELKPAWNIAMEDGVLTWSEAKEIIEGAGEKMDPEE
jgi:hypothetical protein